MNKTKLFFIPYAGGTSITFKKTGELLSPDIEAFLIDYAGHGSRSKEPYYEDWDELVSDIAEKINSQIRDGDQIAVFGYSIGTVVAYELIARSLLRVSPSHVFLASHEAPDLEWDSKQFYLLSDEELLETLRPKGGFDRVGPEMLKNRAFYRIFFEPIRADYRLIGQYRMSEEKTFPAPVTLFYSEEDLEESRIHTWDKFIEKLYATYEFSGNHFFIRDHEEEVAEIIKRTLEEETLQ